MIRIYFCCLHSCWTIRSTIVCTPNHSMCLNGSAVLDQLWSFPTDITVSHIGDLLDYDFSVLSDAWQEMTNPSWLGTY